MAKFVHIRERVPVVLLGEKDHGKSTLIGRLLHDTKSIPPDRIRGAKAGVKTLGKKFEWAHLLDSFRYEREHEMTLDTTRAYVKWHGREFEFIDVPGHKELMKNMLSGAGDAEFGILMIDAVQGMTRQTERHVALAKFLGIKKMIVAVNKMDAVKYNRTVFEKISSDAGKILAKAGFAKFFILPISAAKNENVLKNSRHMPWYKEYPLMKQAEKRFVSRKHTPEKPVLKNKFIADCVFLKKPGRAIYFQSGPENSRIKKLTHIKFETYAPLKIDFQLSKNIELREKCVIKEKGGIIALCRPLS